MDPLHALVASRPVISTAELRAAGHSERELTAAVRYGSVRRLRRGWYSILPLDDPRAMAVTVGGRLTGASALRRRGAWMWREPPVEVSVAHNASRLRSCAYVGRLHWDAADVQSRGTAWETHPLDSLVHALGSLSFEEAVAVIDWAFWSGLLDRNGFVDLGLRLPKTATRILDWADPSTESFIESIPRTRLRQARHRVTTQVSLPNGQRLDLVVDGHVVIEVDGREFHADTFEADRRKDAFATRLGYHVIRLSASQIERDWPNVVLSIEDALYRRSRPAELPLSRVPAVPASGNTARAWRLSPPRPERRGQVGIRVDHERLRAM